MTKCLIIDDSFFSRHMIAKSIRELGYEVDEADSGQAGLDAIAATQYDCIFCDLLMPEMSGFEVLETLQNNNNQIPVVVVTSDIQDSSKEKSLELGAKDFANKPLFKHKDKLSALINKVTAK